MHHAVVYLVWETRAGLGIALNIAGYMAKAVLAWVVEVGPIGPKNDMLKLPKLKIVDLAVDCKHTMGCMEKSMRQC